MNQHDDGRGQDHGWEDPAEAGLLKQTLGAMAGGVDPASPTGPAAAMPVMSKRVRRRRTAKLGGLGGGTLALAGALVLGAGQLAPPEQAEVLLPGGSAPSQSAEASPSPRPDLQIRDGYQPEWLAGTDLTCGVPVADLESTAQGWSVATGRRHLRAAGRPQQRRARDAARHGGDRQKGDGTLQGAPVLVWSQDGVVVGVGTEVFVASELRRSAARFRGGCHRGPGRCGLDLHAQGGPVTARSSTTPLPEGDYDVRVVALPTDQSGGLAVAVSDPVQVRIDADGAHSPTNERGGESVIEFPEPVDGQVARFDLDRTTDWVTAELTRPRYSSGTPMRVVGQCDGPDPEALLPIEVVLWPTGDVLASTQISCDGDEAGDEIEIPADAGATLDIRLPSIPDGVGRAWVSLEPATPES